MTISKHFILKLTAMAGLVLFLTTALTSCKKDKAEGSSSSSIEGSWAGKRGDAGETPGYDFRFTIKAGGAIDATNASGAVKGSGSWTLNGTEFKANYQFVAPLFTKYQVKGNYDAATGKISGVWGFDDGLYEEGTFYLDKLQ
ncbi:MAG: hypothetical protein QM737_15595 [Ferruginibacter sp.]